MRQNARRQHPRVVPYRVAKQWQLIRKDELHEPQLKQANRTRPLNESKTIAGSGYTICRRMIDATMQLNEKQTVTCDYVRSVS